MFYFGLMNAYFSSCFLLMRNKQFQTFSLKKYTKTSIHKLPYFYILIRINPQQLKQLCLNVLQIFRKYLLIFNVSVQYVLSAKDIHIPLLIEFKEGIIEIETQMIAN